ncbi:MAG: helix-turn-helix domain-containing protein [Trueperaceae bacterium]|nr:helix-turn-helix domain-containing protein [Trueperaceae bacterium]
MKSSDAVDAMQALGHPFRLGAYRELMRAGRTGSSINELQRSLGGVPRSTLSHHLNKLVAAGLVGQEKRGATVVCHARYETMDALVGYLTAECCADERATAASHDAA